MACRKRKSPATERAPQRIEYSAVERWRKSCPVQSQHKAVFPADEWLWQPGAAAWVWSVLKAAGGTMQAEGITQKLAQLREISRRQATGLRNRGLTVLEAFGLVKIERFTAVRSSRPTNVYGNVSIILDKIDEKAARRKKKRIMMERWNDSLCQAFTLLADNGVTVD